MSKTSLVVVLALLPATALGSPSVVAGRARFPARLSGIAALPAMPRPEALTSLAQPSLPAIVPAPAAAGVSAQAAEVMARVETALPLGTSEARDSGPALDRAFDNSAGASAPVEAPADIWPILERNITENLGIRLAPGRTAQWARGAGDWLRNNPAASVEAALAWGAAPVYGLSQDNARAVEDFLSNQAVDRMRDTTLVGFLRAGDDVYSATIEGLYIRKNDRWQLVLDGQFHTDVVYEAGGRVYASTARDDFKVYEIVGDRVEVVGKRSSSSLEPPVEFANETYLSMNDGGLWRRASGRWTKVAGVPDSVTDMAVLGRELVVATHQGLYRIGPDGQARSLSSPLRSVTYLVAHAGGLFAMGNGEQGYAGYAIDANGGAIRTELPAVYKDGFILHAGRPYKMDGNRFFAWQGREWVRVKEIQGEIYKGFYTSDDQGLYVDTKAGLYEVAGAQARRIRDSVGKLHGIGHYAGRRFALAATGLYEVEGDRWTLLVPAGRDSGFGGIFERGPNLYVGMDSALKDIVLQNGLPDNWRQGLLGKFAAAIEAQASGDLAEPPAADEAGRIFNQDGKMLFGLSTRRSGR
ncbi:MAG: hypothetical protein PHF00_05715 [Elusimicrobia bacterium]|nr:hypothetical protein [Elusimicrobiota bacterium]